MQTFRKQLGIWSKNAVDMILPPRCAVNGAIVERQGMLSPEAWAGLDFISDPLCALCGLPFDYEIEPGAHCTACLNEPPPFKTARSILTYNETGRQLVLGFKHADKTYMVTAFGPWLARAGADMLKEADMLVPVPLHRFRLLKRRYNQAVLLAYALAGQTGIPVRSEALRRVRATPSQGHLGAKERMKNVSKAFVSDLRHKQALRGKTVILVDDVYTTGATVSECANVLLKNGALAVHVLTVARVVRGINF